MKTRAGVIKQLHETQSAYDQLLYEIGMLSAHNKLANPETEDTTLSNKIRAFQQIEHQLRDLEKELANKEE